jgi:hypothetical protein
MPYAAIRKIRHSEGHISLETAQGFSLESGPKKNGRALDNPWNGGIASCQSFDAYSELDGAGPIERNLMGPPWEH